MREVIWARGLKILGENPWLGVGVDCFSTAYGQALEHEKFSKIGNVYDRSWKVAHNSFIQVGAEMGVPGLLVFLLLIGLSIKNFRETKRLALAAARCACADSDIHHYQVHLLAGMFSLALTGFLVCGFFLSQAYSVFPYLFLAVSGSLRRQFGQERKRAG
jgi:O-antigen ligase